MPPESPRRRAPRSRRSRQRVPAYVEDPVVAPLATPAATGANQVRAVEAETTVAPDPATAGPADRSAPAPTPIAERPGARATVLDVAPRRRHYRGLAALWGLVVAGGLACLVAAIVPVGPVWLDRVGAITVVTAYTWALAARSGGRPVVFGLLALVLGVTVQVVDEPYLRTGAAVMTCVVAAVLAVMATVPAVRFAQAARECVLAVLIAAGGALATIGFDPVLSVVRFEYVTLGLALASAFILVHRLGAGLHGLGRRGLIGVVAGGLVLGGLLLYAELLRRYGPSDMVGSLLDAVRWSRDTLGAFPRPIVAVLGVPTLVWGVHMRARRRQGWWLCAFGAAATTAVANSLVNPEITLLECGLSVLYGTVVGLVVGYAVVRVDLALTGSRGAGGRRAEESAAVRPEPARTAPLF
ncbi:hypothetical protein [Nocardioides sp. SYSU D00038]|uniref:hypothetical protein n=1 Tax=Nocardioides sp. SYSU D00038 TaxID=2812554 RepID=UPI0019680F25|nr:hypothetical protein [Nocardioides sp. SYSU D00038]